MCPPLPDGVDLSTYRRSSTSQVTCGRSLLHLFDKQGCERMKKAELILGCAFAAALWAAAPTQAQDSHYWTEQFGNRAYLL
jgi:hypothetical protein